jgi:hypothetical protein
MSPRGQSIRCPGSRHVSTFDLKSHQRHYCADRNNYPTTHPLPVRVPAGPPLPYALGLACSCSRARYAPVVHVTLTLRNPGHFGTHRSHVRPAPFSRTRIRARPSSATCSHPCFPMPLPEPITSHYTRQRRMVASRGLEGRCRRLDTVTPLRGAACCVTGAAPPTALLRRLTHHPTPSTHAPKLAPSSAPSLRS